jgi:hypothetical protein
MMEKRRSERLSGRFVVVVHEKLATWTTTTEDVSARGCRIEMKRPVSPGMLVGLTFDMGQGVEPLVVHGQVSWARRTPPYSAGIAFLSVPRQAKDQPGKPGDWIDRLIQAYVRKVEDRPPLAVTPTQAATPGSPAEPAVTPAPAETPVPAPGRGSGGVGRVRAQVIVPPAP